MKVPAAIKKVPPIVWVIAGGAVLALYFLSRGQGSATGGLPTGNVSAGDSGGGGGGSDQGFVTSDQLQDFISQEQDAQQSFMQDVLGLITDPAFKGPKGDTGAPGTPGKPGLPGKPGAPGGTVTRPVTPIESVLRRLVISNHSTPVYDKPGGKVIGHIGTGSYFVKPRVKIGGRWYYQIVRTVSGKTTSYATHYIPAEPWEKITTPTTPAKVA